MPLGDHRRQAIEEEVTRPRSLRWPRGRASRSGNLREKAAGSCQRTSDAGGHPGVKVGLPGEPDIERFESPGGPQQQNRRLAPGNGCPLDLPSELLHASTLQIVNRVSFGLGQQAERGVESACVEVRQGGCQRSADAPRRLGGQGERPLKEGRRGRQPGAALGLDRRLLERGGHLFVRPGGRGCQVPHPALRIGLGIGRRGERQVGGAAILRGPGRVSSRPHQGMPEPHEGADLQQLSRIGRGRRITSQAQRRCGTPQQRGVPGGVGRREQQQSLGRLRQRPHPLQVVVLETTGQTRRGRTGKAAGQLGFAQPSRQLQQPQRISPGLGHDPVANPLVQMTWDRGGQQRPRVLVGEPFDCQLRQTGKHPLAGRLPDREQEQHRLSQQPPSDEPEHLGRGVIQPLRVIDQAAQRRRGGILGQQAQHRQTHHEPVRSSPRRQPERHTQRTLLRLRQRGQATQHRPAELMQRRERQLHLGLHAGDLNQAAA